MIVSDVIKKQWLGKLTRLNPATGRGAYLKLNAKVRADIAAELPVLRAALKLGGRL